MRAVITNFGTTGDIYPLLALAAEMQARGREPVLAFSPNYKSLADRLGLNFVPIGDDLRQVQNDANKALIHAPESTDQIFKTFAILAKSLPQSFKDLEKACQGMDIIISGPAQPAARMIHELSGTPFVSVQFSHFGGIGSPTLREAGAALVNPFRIKLGLKPLRDPLTIDSNSPMLALYAMSGHVYPRPPTWPPHYYLTGYFFLEDGAWRPDSDLIGFLDAGEPPIVISLGSMLEVAPDIMMKTLSETIDKIGRRAVIQRGLKDQKTIQYSPNVIVVGYAPHAWLFPYASCIVHHGGAGTTAAVFRSGKPSVFAPHGHLFDQYYWAILAHDLGCAPAPVLYEDFTAQRAAEAIVETLSTSFYTKNASLLGQKIRSENGAIAALTLIEKLSRECGRNCEPLYELNARAMDQKLIAQAEYKRDYQKGRRLKKTKVAPSD